MTFLDIIFSFATFLFCTNVVRWIVSYYVDFLKIYIVSPGGVASVLFFPDFYYVVVLCCDAL